MDNTMWGFYDDERLQSSPDEVIEGWLDDFFLFNFEKGGTEQQIDLPRTIELWEYRPREIKDTDLAFIDVLTPTLESLDEEFGDLDDYTQATPKMEQAALDFLKVVKDEYRVWQCEPTGHTETIDVYEWLKENDPKLVNGETPIRFLEEKSDDD